MNSVDHLIRLIGIYHSSIYETEFWNRCESASVSSKQPPRLLSLPTAFFRPGSYAAKKRRAVGRPLEGSIHRRSAPFIPAIQHNSHTIPHSINGGLASV